MSYRRVVGCKPRHDRYVNENADAFPFPYPVLQGDTPWRTRPASPACKQSARSAVCATGAFAAEPSHIVMGSGAKCCGRRALAHIGLRCVAMVLLSPRRRDEEAMSMQRDLVVGRYYWVIPAPDRETSTMRRRPVGMGTRADWQDEIQPARFNGWIANGEMCWNFLGTDDSWNWPILWIGDPIELPVMPTRKSGKLDRNSYGHAN